ncbi:MAG: LacI family DNA-binding transcriptional regulator [Chitinophagaceae bacterium]|nr:LacI family DNA-binding transcriptional regulator [Chitinophagaceae bacterium]
MPDGTEYNPQKISEQLNLSISTISRALKDHPDISENTRRKVKELAALMEYEPNALAVNLRTSKSKVIGLIVPSFFNTFNESLIAAAENEARKSGYSLMVLQSGDDPIREADNLKLCKNYRVDGVLISVVTDSYSMETFRRYRDMGLPLIFFDRVPDGDEFDTVCMADDEVATLAANTILKYQKKKYWPSSEIPNSLLPKKEKKRLKEHWMNQEKLSVMNWFAAKAVKKQAW